MRKILFLVALALVALPAAAADVAPEPALDLGATDARAVNDCRAQGGGQCICPQYYAPVCGCDGKDYPNPDCASCKVTSWTEGTCDGGGIFLAEEPELAEPAGEADVAPEGEPLELEPAEAQPTQCRRVPPVKNCTCIHLYDPVCGCDGNTYSNSCFASCSVTSWTEGACGAVM